MFLVTNVTSNILLHCKNEGVTMTPFFGANSLCENDTLFWCRVTVTP